MKSSHFETCRQNSTRSTPQLHNAKGVVHTPKMSTYILRPNMFHDNHGKWLKLWDKWELSYTYANPHAHRGMKKYTHKTLDTKKYYPFEC